MDLSNLVQTLAVLIEVAVTVVAVLIALQNHKVYGWFIALTFALFVLFDIFRIFLIPISPEIHALLLVAASASMLFAVWLIYSEQE